MKFPLLLFLILQSLPSLNVVFAVAGEDSAAAENPFTPKAYLIRYWKNQILNDFPAPPFLLDKASPLTAAQLAVFSKLAGDPNSLSDHLPDFCAKANLLCFPDPSPSLEKHDDNVNFTSYVSKNFTDYGSGHIGGANTFRGYSDGGNVVSDSFRRYSRDATGHDENFTSYAAAVNIPEQSFSGYGTTATGGEGRFGNYNGEVNSPNLRFTAYSDNSNGREQKFAEYTGGANSGEQGFTSYGKNGNGAVDEFRNYGRDSNVMRSEFRNYGETGNGGNDTFASYGAGANLPENNFANYGAAANGAVVSFRTYRPDSNVGDDEFTSYAGKSKATAVGFESYGRPDNGGGSKFTGYGGDAVGQTVDFKLYNPNPNFTDYGKEGNTFSGYTHQSSSAANKLTAGGKTVNKWAVEPGKFFREGMLKNGSLMPMPDIRDKMPKRSFLPRALITKLPFSTAKINELKKIFHAGENSSMAKILSDSLRECERAPSPGETKCCTGSIEDMIDFATAVLGRSVVVRSTENTRGSNGDIMIGEVQGINGGNVTESVSCHQSLFPYLLYYCHSVPKVRVYEADILDPISMGRINRGVAICHLDTSSWSPGHGAFVALGSGPGMIEVCHWIFENDMTWTVAD